MFIYRCGVDSFAGEGGALGGLDTVGPRGSPFRFAEWEGGEIRVFGAWCGPASEKDGEKDGLADVREWIEGLE